MNENAKDILVKIAMTIPALLAGVVALLIILFKPVIELWVPSLKPAPPAPPQKPEIKHDFH